MIVRTVPTLIALALSTFGLAACSALGGGDDDPPAGSEPLPPGVAPNDPDAPQTSGNTDVGCGGLGAPACLDGKKCRVGKDCASGSCVDGTCAAPSATDGATNGDESDVDCGGQSTKAPRCADGKACGGGGDCVSGSCLAGACAAPRPDDGVKNGTETDVDCGGPGEDAARCADGKACGGGGDCASLVCTGGACIPPKPNDGVKNGDESDVDCGGTTTGAAKCATGKACKAHLDCASDGCADDGLCALGRSCTKRAGGATCGEGEVGQGGANHESCCASAPLVGTPAKKLDKYLVTAGRMRAMIERLQGNVRGFVGGLPAGQWNAAWNPYVPSNLVEADNMLGSYFFGAPNDADAALNPWSKRSCEPGAVTGHTYWTPKNGADFTDFDQESLDAKALNCVGWHLLSAFCAWDGGTLASRADILDAFTNGGTTPYPWNHRDARPFTVGAQDPFGRLDYQFSYGWPLVARRMSGAETLDAAWHVAPPGRHPLGGGKNGHQDVAGNLLHFVSDAEYTFIWNFSWERHDANGPLRAQNWRTAWPGEPNGYYAIGGRCVR